MGTEFLNLIFAEAFNRNGASHYAQALKIGMDYLLAASRFFEDLGIDIDQPKDALDIGRAGRDGESV